MAGGMLRVMMLAALSSSVLVIASDDDEKKAEEGDAAAFEGVDNPEADIHERLVMAAFDGRDEDVEALINEGAPLDKRHTDGVTALFMAAQNGNTRSVRYLLEAGANVDRARQTDRTTPLMRAAYNGHTRVAQQLVDAGADMAKKDKNGANTAACLSHEAVFTPLAACRRVHRHPDRHVHAAPRDRQDPGGRRREDGRVSGDGGELGEQVRVVHVVVGDGHPLGVLHLVARSRGGGGAG